MNSVLLMLSLIYSVRHPDGDVKESAGYTNLKFRGDSKTGDGNLEIIDINVIVISMTII